jgi:hypothetical protein
MKHCISFPSLKLLAACFALCATSHADTFIVRNTLPTGSGSLHQTVLNAASADTIAFSISLNGQSIQLGEKLVLNKGLTIDASALPNGIKLLGNGRVIEVTGGQTVVLRALEVRNGYDADQGGGIYNAGTLTLDRCTIANNGTIFEGVHDPDRGGGIYNTGILTLNQCTLSGNVASMSGAAIYNQSGASLTVNHSTITGNECLNGTGGIRNGGSLTLNNTILAGNIGSSDPNLENTGTLTLQGNNITTGDPQLAPLGDYGGPTQTMPPLNGSPAIDAGADDTVGSLTTDQRGLPRFSRLHVDIGAAEWQMPALVVTSLEDSGPGSLRESVVGAPMGARITFGTALAGQRLTLTSGEIALNSLFTIDASALSGGVTLAGNNASRLLNIGAGGSVTLVGLTLTNGRVTSGHGGAIFNGGVLTVDRCTVAGNTANEGHGGAIFNGGVLTVNRCTVAGNSANNGQGGGIHNPAGSRVTLLNSTFQGNTAYEGGAVRCTGGALAATNCTFTANIASIGGACSIADGGPEAQLSHLTIAGNQATNGFYGGGGLFFYAQSATLRNSIVAANTSSGGAGDLDLVGSNLTLQGANLVQSHSGGLLGPDPINQAPLLAPLGNYGGPTQTMPPLFGSPAINAGGVSALETEQRGFPRVIDTAADLGAVEYYPTTAVVTTAADNGPGSLRYAIERSSPVEMTVITFDPSLSGQTILLTSGELSITRNLTIIGPGAANLTVSGNSVSRVFQIAAGVTSRISGLTIRDGHAPDGRTGDVGSDGSLNAGGDGGDGGGGDGGSGGGAIYNAGTLTMAACTLSGNQAGHGGAGGTGGPSKNGGRSGSGSGGPGGPGAAGGSGGAIYNAGALELTTCDLIDNRAGRGGAGGSGGDLNHGESGESGGDGGYGGPGGSGGAILNAGTLEISACTLIGNLAGSGASGGSGGGGNSPTSGGNGQTGGEGGAGGAIRSVGALGLTACTLSGNHAGAGGEGGGGERGGAGGFGGTGGAIHSAATLELVASTLSGNHAGAGGSGGSGGGFSSSQVGGDGGEGGYGGAIFNAGTLESDVCTFNGNHAGAAAMPGQGYRGNWADARAGGQGGAIYNASTLGLTACTLSGNHAGPGLPGDWFDEESPRSSGGSGGGIYNAAAASLRNVLVAGNLFGTGGAGSGQGPDLLGAFTSLGSNLVGIGEGSSGLSHGVNGDQVGTNAIPIDPLLAALANNGGPTWTMALLQGSSALDAGDNTLTGYDQRGTGFPRQLGLRVDIGAHEGARFLPVIAADSPGTVTTDPATKLSQLQYTASVSPGGVDTLFFLQYGPTTNYGLASPSHPLGHSPLTVPYSQALSNLPPGVTHYRLVAQNFYGTFYGADHIALISPGVPGDTDGNGEVSPEEFAAVRTALSDELATQNAAGYFTEAQVQSLNVGKPLINQVSSGRFRITFGVQKSTDLNNPFTDFSLATSGSSVLVNPEGKIEIEFPSTDAAAFFRVEAE